MEFCLDRFLSDDLHLQNGKLLSSNSEAEGDLFEWNLSWMARCLYIYIYIYVYTHADKIHYCVYMCIYIYLYTHSLPVASIH